MAIALLVTQLVLTVWSETTLLFLDGHHLAEHKNLTIRVGDAWLISEMKDPSSFVG